MSYNFTSYELHFHLLPFAPYWVLFCAKTPNQKMTKIPTPEDKLQVSSLGFHRVASASLSSLVGNGYLQHDGPYWLGRSDRETDRLVGPLVLFLHLEQRNVCSPHQRQTHFFVVFGVCVFLCCSFIFQMHIGCPPKF